MPQMARRFGKSILSGGIVHISVGADEIPFDVHLELLCDGSPYFDSLFKDRSEKPISEDPLQFPDDDPDTFSEFLGWMYHGEISIELVTPSRMRNLFQLWVLAGKFEVPTLQNNAIQCCKVVLDKNPGAIFGCDTIKYIYTHTLPKSPLRLLLVGNWTQNATKMRFLDRQEDLPPRFLNDLCCALIEEKERRTDTPTGYMDSVERYLVPEAVDNKREPFSQAVYDPYTKKTATREQMRNREILPLGHAYKTSSASPHSSEGDRKSEI